MENNRLDVTKSIQALKIFIENIGRKDVKGSGYDNAAVSSISSSKSIKSVKEELGELLGVSFVNYSLEDICKKVLDKGVDLSTDWKYQFEYRFVPNVRKPSDMIITIWDSHTDICANENKEYKSLEEKGVVSVVKKKVAKTNKKYTEEELDYMQKLYVGDGDAAEKFYMEDKHKMTKKKKIQLEAQFKVKYPKFKGVNDGVIWQSFYESRLHKRKNEFVKLKVIEDEIKQELDTVEPTVVIEPNNNEQNVKEKVSGHLLTSYYVDRIREYVNSVGVGEYRFVAIDFVNEVFNTESFTKNANINSLQRIIRKCFKILDLENDFLYTGVVKFHKINKEIEDVSVYNEELILKIKDKVVVPIENEVNEEDSEVVCDSCLTNIDDEEQKDIKTIISECVEHIEVKRREYTVSYSVDLYLKKAFGKNKYLGTRSVQLEIVIDADKPQEELDERVRENIAYFMNSSSPDDKLDVRIKQINNRDYNVILNREI